MTTGVTGTGGWVGYRHRSLSVHKTENGFSVKAAFFDPKKPDKWDRREEREFVYYTVEEVVGFVKEYLEAEPDELQK